eukprot:1862220-Rhodomonas_salina.1
MGEAEGSHGPFKAYNCSNSGMWNYSDGDPGVGLPPEIESFRIIDGAVRQIARSCFIDVAGYVERFHCTIVGIPSAEGTQSYFQRTRPIADRRFHGTIVEQMLIRGRLVVRHKPRCRILGSPDTIDGHFWRC